LILFDLLLAFDLMWICRTVCCTNPHKSKQWSVGLFRFVVDLLYNMLLQQVVQQIRS